MIDLLRWILRRREHSKDAARRRLHLILVMDRIGVSAELMETMKGTIIAGLSDYIVVDEGSLELDIRREGDSMVLVSNVQVKEVVRTFATVAS
jgi:cell division topological specificity factor